MGVRERRAAPGQAIDVRCLCHRMPTEIADPIVLIIDRNKENVRIFIRCLKRGRQHDRSQQLKREAHAHHL